jgi:hypothetical protein
LLEVFIERHRDTPFAWGVHDCVTFAIGWLELAREDLAPRDDLAPRLAYGSAHEAARELGQQPLAEAVEAWGELPRIGVTFAQRGDLVLLDVGGRQTLGLCVGGDAAGPSTHGIEFAPMTAAVAAWRV